METEILKKMRAEANRLLGEARATEEEYKGKDMPADVKAQVATKLDKVIDLTEDIKRNQKLDDLDDYYHKADDANRLPVVGADGKVIEKADELTPERKAFRQGLQGRAGNVTFKGNGLVDAKALQGNTNDQGGYLIAPQEFIAELVRAVHDDSVVESVARVFPLARAQSLGAPSLDTTLNDADWTTEVATISEDTALKTGKRELNPTKLSKLVKISQTLIRQAALDPEGLVREEMAYKFSITKDKGFLTGSGANQPLGVFTASAQGISTGRDSACANNNKVIGDDFIKAKMTLKAQYQGRPTTKWCLHRDVLSSLMVEKASTAGTYMFMPGLSAQTPDTILAIPYMLSENAPNTLTSGKYVFIIGDWRFYWIANAMDFEVQVLNELYALNDYIGYIGRLWSDGMPVLEEAFVRGKLA